MAHYDRLAYGARARAWDAVARDAGDGVTKSDLEKRIAELERRVRELEARPGANPWIVVMPPQQQTYPTWPALPWYAPTYPTITW